MKIVVHDFAGHAFQLPLSRELADRGHTVYHTYCASLAGPQGTMKRLPDDPSTFSVVPVEAPHAIDKNRIVGRFIDEIRYGLRLRRFVHRVQPDVVISSNAPTHVQALLQGVLVNRTRVPVVLWVQDLYGVAIRAVLSRDWGLLGVVASAPFVMLDRRLARSARHVVVISEEFLEPLGLVESAPSTSVIRNWALPGDITLLPKDNEWSRARGLHRTENLVYAGTLGMKHRPELLVDLAEHLQGREDARVVVVASGTGMDWLRANLQRFGLTNLLLFSTVPFSDLSKVLACSDIQIALLESDAGEFSVPSKILTYLCARRAVLASLPRTNLAWTVLESSGGGLMAEPGAEDSFLKLADRLLDDSELRERLANNGDTYARTTFDIERIVDQFEGILTNAV